MRKFGRDVPSPDSVASGTLTDRQIDDIATGLVSQYIGKSTRQYEKDTAKKQFEREGGLFGFMANILMGKKVEETAFQLGTAMITKVMKWAIVALLLFLLVWYFIFKKPSQKAGF